MTLERFDRLLKRPAQVVSFVSTHSYRESAASIDPHRREQLAVPLRLLRTHPARAGLLSVSLAVATGPNVRT